MSTIIAIFRRELTVAARERAGRRVHGELSSFALLLAAVVVGTFGAWLYWSKGVVTSRTMLLSMHAAAGWCAVVHFGIAGAILVRGAWSITKERDRRTLESLLTSPMTNADIVLGKLASCLGLVFASIAAGLPVTLLLHALGGIDLGLIAVCYAIALSSVLFLSSLAIWISAEASDTWLAYCAFLLAAMVWAIGPFSVSVFAPRLGITLPEWLAATNAWLVQSSPVALLLPVATGLSSWTQLCYIAGRTIALQLVGSALLTIGAIARLRSAQRGIGKSAQLAGQRPDGRPVWRFWRRPPVNDDPILWREMYTTRGNGLMKAVGAAINLGFLAALCYATCHFASPAVVEVWRHGYQSGVTSAEPPELNLFVRMLVPTGRPSQPVDLARTDFNLFLRFVTISIMVLLPFSAVGSASQVLALERRKETWNSLLGTPLEPRDILRSAILAALWRVRQPMAILAVLSTLGLLAGALHPLGYFLALLNPAASVWFFAAWGLRGSVGPQDQDRAAAAAKGGNLLLLSLLALALPFLLPERVNSVFWGAGSPVFVGWLSCLSYREVRAAFHDTAYSPLAWIGIDTGEGLLPVLAACVLGIVGFAVGGWLAWRYTISHFDRLVGRPWRAEKAVLARPKLEFLATRKQGARHTDAG
jgi:ABC-type Na+ efflux pump permease subunit